MHSWVYRNRSRLKLIYGSTPAPPQAPVAGDAAAEVGLAVPPPPPAGAGMVVRRERYVLLRPMPPRAS